MLRDYQKILVDDIRNEWSRGNANVLAMSATGSGKTVVFAHLMQQENGPCIALAHRAELVAQMSMALARNKVRHRIVGSASLARNAVSMHMKEFGRSFYDPGSPCAVASIGTLVRLDQNDRLFRESKLVVIDEAHHALAGNTYGKVVNMFIHTKVLGVTATPGRPDGKGLGRHADGIFDVMVKGPEMRLLIERGYLSDYRVLIPPSDLDLSDVEIGSGGDYRNDQLRKATHRSHIVGDVVTHYLRYASGKLGMTFAVDIESAKDIANAFNAAGVPAIEVDGSMSDIDRITAMRRFRAGEIKQLVSCDLLGEGTDVPGVEVISMARATASVIVYMQQFGRALRILEGKDKAIILDHVGNFINPKLGGPPDRPRNWSLDRRDKRKASSPNEIPLRVCTNPDNGLGVPCASPYERVLPCCPYCGFAPVPAGRSAPAQVDGDLLELDAATLAAMRGEIERIDGDVRIPRDVDSIVARAIANKHQARQEAQRELREAIAQWAGVERHQGRGDSEIYRRFWHAFGVDIMTAQTLGAREAMELRSKINV